MTPARRAPRGDGGSTSLDRLRRRLGAARDTDEAELFSAIAKQVGALRRKWDLSQAELADLCGTTQSAIARIERGARPPRIDTLLRVANALDSELIVELRPRTRVRGG